MKAAMTGRGSLARLCSGGVAGLVLLCGSLFAGAAVSLAEEALPVALYPVGAAQVEYFDPAEGRRPLNYLLIYPAEADAAAPPFEVFLATNLELYKDAPIATHGGKRPLIVFSHGAGGNGSTYAWFGQYLAARGYVVALAYHYRAHSFDWSALHVRNRLWQRPRDLSLHITHLLQDDVWGPLIDPERIGVAGHSQGGFTALWLGGAGVDSELFETFQRRWKESPVLPAYLREEMEIDVAPARNLRDERVKAAFAMAPGDIQGFGMDAAGLRQMAIPTYVIVGAGDTTTPPAENGEFAARHIPEAQFELLPGPVGHEIFTNQCDQLGQDNYPEGCRDAPGVDRASLHDHIGQAALRFFEANLQVR